MCIRDSYNGGVSLYLAPTYKQPNMSVLYREKYVLGPVDERSAPHWTKEMVTYLISKLKTVVSIDTILDDIEHLESKKFKHHHLGKENVPPNSPAPKLMVPSPPMSPLPDFDEFEDMPVLKH